MAYGPHKIGKSSFGADAPSPIFVTTEDGVDNIPVDQFPKAETWQEFIANVEQVARGEHEHKALVIDTLNGAVDLAARYICSEQFSGVWAPKKGTEAFLSYGNGWAATAEECRKLIVLFDACRNRGMIVLLLAHTGLQNVKNPLEGDFQKYAPDIDKRVWSVFARWADVVGRADYEYTYLKSSNPNAKGRVVSTSTRVLRFEGGAAEDVGCRVGFSLPPILPLSWSEFDAAIGNDTSTLDEVRAIWPVVPDEKRTKILAWLGVTKLEDARLAKLKEVLNQLRRIKADADATEIDKESDHVAA